MTSEIQVRTASILDVDLYFNWANDPLVRENSFEKGVIKYEDHVKWFHEKIKDPNHVLYIFSIHATPIGQVRFSIYDEKAIINYSIDQKFRGKGYSTKIISQSIASLMSTKTNINSVVAKVKPKNIASIKAFLGCMFDLISEKPDEFIFEYHIH